MTLGDIAIKILNQLRGFVQRIEESDFTKTSATLNGSTIGQHVRHTLEFFLCLEAGYRHGVVNYDNRPHDKNIETDKQLAMDTIAQIVGWVSRLEEQRDIVLEVGYDPRANAYISVPTNALRELVYNIEHAVHHMAIIKIGVRELAPYISLESDFGVAASTMRFRMAGNEVLKTLS